MENLQNNIRNAATITRLTQIIVDDMRCFKKIIPISAFKIVAKKVIDSYPIIFIDIDRDGIILGDGSHKFVQKLIDRNNYLNRPLQKRTSENNSGNPVKNKKISRAGCSNWAPEILSWTLSNDDRRTKETDEDFYSILERCYPEIRSGQLYCLRNQSSGISIN